VVWLSRQLDLAPRRRRLQPGRSSLVCRLATFNPGLRHAAMDGMTAVRHVALLSVARRVVTVTLQAQLILADIAMA